MRGPRRTFSLFVVSITLTFLTAGGAITGGAGLPVATMDAPNALVPEIESLVWVTDEPGVEIPIVLDVAAPIAGQVSWTAWFDFGDIPGTGAVPFPVGSSSGAYAFEFAAAPPVEIVPGWELRRVVTYLGSGQNVTVGFPSVMNAARVTETSARGKDCVAVVWYEIMCLLVPGGCFDSRGAAQVDILRRYRDEILDSSDEGRYYVDRYEARSLELARAALKEPAFLARFFRMQGAWVTAISALVNGSGSAVVVSTEMQDDLLSLLDSLQANGTPQLAAELAFERSRLELDSIAGLTIAEFQTRVETLGGVTSVEPASWGRVKSLYR
jgi:hypothetical protein